MGGLSGIRSGIDYWVTPRIAAGYPSNLISLCVLRALRGDISLLLKQIRDCGWLHWPAKPSAPMRCDSVCLPRTTERPVRKPRSNSVVRKRFVLYPARLERGKRGDEPRTISIPTSTTIVRGECSDLLVRAAPQSHGRKSVVRGLPRSTRRIYNQIISAPEVQTPWSI